MIKCKACGIEGVHACLGNNPKFIIPTPEEWIAQCEDLEDAFIEKEGMSRKEYFEKMYLGVWECDLDNSRYFKDVVINPDIKLKERKDD